MSTTARTRVAIVGAGPAGLVLSHLLDEAGIDSIVLERRTRDEVEHTIRAGILEQGTADLLREIDPSSRVDTVGTRHDGIELRIAGEGYRIDLRGLTGRSVWLYPQHEVLTDLVALRLRHGQDVRFGVEVTRVLEADSDRPRLLATTDDGEQLEVHADVVVGADGSHSVVRSVVGGPRDAGHFREYPYAWFGILCEAAPSAPELIYSASDDGFALISQRSPTVQRMYFQCDPDADPNALSDTEIWATLRARVPGTTLAEGPVFQRDVLRFRSFVAPALRRGRAYLVGDAAHVVPPTGAKGMNLAVADVVLLARALRAALVEGDDRLVDTFETQALERIWKAQNFSWWMTSMLHQSPGASSFDRLRQLGELRSVVSSEAGRTYLAEGYSGWPFAVA